jgi:hypothetical protein
MTHIIPAELECSVANENGVLEKGIFEEAARYGRWYASIAVARAEDGRYRHSEELLYSYGGFASPVWEDTDSYATLSEARTAAFEKLLRRFPCGRHGPESARNELRILREQIEAKLRQPSLF